MSRIMSAIEGISDEHIERFAFVQIPKRKIPLWVKIGSAVASLVLIIFTVTMTEYLTRGHREVGGWLPYVNFNDVRYIISPATSDFVTELPEGYVFVGAVSSNDHITDKYSNGYSTCCAVGDEIYQDLSDLQDMYVRTKFMSNGEFWFMRFVLEKQDPFVTFNDGTYVIASEDYQQSALPNEYVLVATINSNAREDEYSSGYSWCCSVGDEIYQNLGDPDDLYVKTKYLSNNDEYQFIRFEKWY